MKNDVASSFNHLHQDLNQQSFSNIFWHIETNMVNAIPNLFFHVQRLPAALYRVIKYIFENRTNGADACNVRVYRIQCESH